MKWSVAQCLRSYFVLFRGRVLSSLVLGGEVKKLNRDYSFKIIFEGQFLAWYCTWTRTSNWLKTNAFSFSLRVQSCNTSANYKSRAHAFKISTVHVLNFYEEFSCGLLTSNNMISLASWCNMQFFKDNKFHFPCGLVQKHNRNSWKWYPHQKLSLLAQFAGHWIGIAEAMSSNPV